MRTLLALALGILVMTSPAWAAQYCVDTNDRQESALSWIVGQRNAEITKENEQRAKKTPPDAALPAETNQSYLSKRVKDTLRDYVRQHQAETVDNQLKADVEAAADAKKAKIRNILTCDKVVCP